MQQSRTDLIDAVLNSSWSQFTASRFQQSQPTESKFVQSRVGDSQQKNLAETHQRLKIDIDAARQGITKHLVAASYAHRARPPRVKAEGEVQLNMENVPAFEAAASQNSSSIETKQERVVPAYHPHLGSRAQFEKQYGLTPGASFATSRVHSQAVHIKQEVTPSRNIANGSFNASPKQTQEIKQEDGVPTGASNGTFSLQGLPQSVDHQSTAPVAEASWDTVDAWSQQPQQQARVPSPSIKEEGTESPEVTFILSHKEKSQQVVSRPNASGLSASRYASNLSQYPIPPVVKKEALVSHPPQLKNNNTNGYSQALADPLAFMSATGTLSNFKQSHQSQTPMPLLAKRVAPQQTQDPPGPLTVAPQKPESKAFQASGWPEFPSASSNVVHTKSESKPFQPSGWSRFPPSLDKPDKAIVQSGVVSAGISSAKAIPSAPAAARGSAPAMQARATSGSQSFAAEESKKNKKPLEPVKFVPAAWPDDDIDKQPELPPPAKAVEQKTPASQVSVRKAPVLIESSQYQPYIDADPQHRTIAHSIQPSSRVKPLSEVVNADKIMIKNLEAQLDRQGARLETVEQELEAYKEEYTELDHELATYKAEAEYTKNLREENKKLKADYEALKAHLETPATPGAAPTAAQMEWLTARNQELQLENHLREPLFRIGRDIRARFLEEGRESVLHITRREMDKSLLERGHAANSNANAEADAAVLNGRFLTNEQYKKLVPVFHTLYGDYPDVHYKNSPRVREAMEAYATCQTSAACNSKHPSLPVEELRRVAHLTKTLCQQSTKMEHKEFDEDTGGHAEKHIVMIKEAMVPILKFDRKWSRFAIKEKLARDATGSSTTKSPAKK
ncbi:uncharacterized protein LY89DRAFT_737954 [Mollisia scopiformis]|uniref:Uncharacterized protein n=1 Tax=Mollisia scopiformis TaxID=149040 RepID=A0A194WZC8_MOLSC|nr:uncharacterized protein LY89DRAFT_737954 [Mollisia scopiformis]KUJ13059.1 hypothetical protein LY89DRAFT_737954 [Mollisia scopiformis]